MLDDVVDGREHRRLAVLDDERAVEVCLGETGQNVISVIEHGLEICQQLPGFGTILLRKLAGTVPLDRARTNSAEYPFGHVASEMDEEIADAV